jgi:hypothetical protein
MATAAPYGLLLRGLTTPLTFFRCPTRERRTSIAVKDS